jgi:hypothetical protein
VSRGSWARAVELLPTSANIRPKVSVRKRHRCSVECTELVVCVSLTHERTVYFTL